MSRKKKKKVPVASDEAAVVLRGLGRLRVLVGRRGGLGLPLAALVLVATVLLVATLLLATLLVVALLLVIALLLVVALLLLALVLGLALRLVLRLGSRGDDLELVVLALGLRAGAALLPTATAGTTLPEAGTSAGGGRAREVAVCDGVAVAVDGAGSGEGERSEQRGEDGGGEHCERVTGVRGGWGREGKETGMERKGTRENTTRQ